jgi:hypothetical protein
VKRKRERGREKASERKEEEEKDEEGETRAYDRRVVDEKAPQVTETGRQQTTKDGHERADRNTHRVRPTDYYYRE